MCVRRIVAHTSRKNERERVSLTSVNNLSAKIRQWNAIPVMYLKVRISAPFFEIESAGERRATRERKRETEKEGGFPDAGTQSRRSAGSISYC